MKCPPPTCSISKLSGTADGLSTDGFLRHKPRTCCCRRYHRPGDSAAEGRRSAAHFETLEGAENDERPPVSRGPFLFAQIFIHRALTYCGLIAKLENVSSRHALTGNFPKLWPSNTAYPLKKSQKSSAPDFLEGALRSWRQSIGDGVYTLSLEDYVLSLSVSDLSSESPGRRLFLRWALRR
jgi:hypothetical protein